LGNKIAYNMQLYWSDFDAFYMVNSSIYKSNKSITKTIRRDVQISVESPP